MYKTVQEKQEAKRSTTINGYKHEQPFWEALRMDFLASRFPVANQSARCADTVYFLVVNILRKMVYFQLGIFYFHMTLSSRWRTAYSYLDKYQKKNLS